MATATTTQNTTTEKTIILTPLELEDAADRLVRDWSDEVPIYTERSLARKIRDEDRRIPTVDETATSEPVVNYLVMQQAKLLIRSAHLTRFEAAIVMLLVDGWDAMGISEEFGLSYDAVRRTIKLARAKISSGGNRYSGLYEVYWSEVHRYIYRAPQR